MTNIDDIKNRIDIYNLHFKITRDIKMYFLI